MSVILGVIVVDREESRGRVVLLLLLVVEEVVFCISVVVGVDKDN